MAVAVVGPIPGALVPAGAAEVIDLELHQPLQRGCRQFLQEIGAVGLLDQLEKCHLLIGHRVISGYGLCVATRPYPRSTMTTSSFNGTSSPLPREP
jgi:hypothetical protein